MRPRLVCPVKLLIVSAMIMLILDNLDNLLIILMSIIIVKIIKILIYVYVCVGLKAGFCASPGLDLALN